MGQSPTYDNSTMHLLAASDQGMVSGFPTTYLLHMSSHMAESVRYVWCLWEAPIMKENIPLHIKGVAKFKIFSGPTIAMIFT